MNKLRAFLLRAFARRAIAAGPSTFDLDAASSTAASCLARLPKGVLGEDTARLLGSFVVAGAWQAAAARARTPEHPPHRRRPVHRRVPQLPQPALPAGGHARRSPRLPPVHVLAHQHLAQLPRDLREGISANARNKVFFNASPEDARALARHTLPDPGRARPGPPRPLPGRRPPRRRRRRNRRLHPHHPPAAARRCPAAPPTLRTQPPPAPARARHPAPTPLPPDHAPLYAVRPRW